MEYEVCYRCHAGANAFKFASVTETPPNRMIAEPDLANRFDFQNPSFHPVSADRKTAGASLLIEVQPAMKRIYCCDCHNNNLGSKAGGSGANGPHGSQYEHILIAEYDMPAAGATRPSYNKSQYALCYRCHSEDYIMGTGTAFSNLGNNGGNEHAAHVRDRQIPCFACHDPHGVPWKLGATPANNSHLINFDRYYAAGLAVPTPFYLSNSSGSGSCTVNCHTVAGNTRDYAATLAKRLQQLKRKAPVRVR